MQCYNFYHQIAFRHNIGKKVGGINNKLPHIANTVNRFNFLENPIIPGKGSKGLITYDAILKAWMTNSTKDNVIGREE